MKKQPIVNPRRSRKATKRQTRPRSFRPYLESLEMRLAPANVDILSYHADVPSIPNYPNGAFLTGGNLQESILTPANVNATNFGRLFSQQVDGYTFAQPLYKANLTIAGGPHNVVFFATEHDSVYAFDADSATAGPNGNGLYWQRSFIDPANRINPVPTGDVNSGDIVPEIGITGSPVIDGATNTLYVVSKTKEIRGDGNHYVQTLHALNIATGADRVTPYVIGDSKGDGFNNQTSAIQVAGNGADSSGGQIKFNAFREHQRPSLQLLNGRVYIGWASHGDQGPYHGWVVGFNEATLQPEKWFNTSPNARGSGIWQSQGALSTDGTFIYFAVGNAFAGPNQGFDPANGNYGEAVLKIDPRPTGTAIAVADYFVPNDWRQLDSADADLGSGGVMLLPDSVGSTAHPHLMIETGKSGKIYLIDRDNLGQNVPQGQPDRVVQLVTAGPGGVWGNPGYYQESATSGLVYYHGSGSDTRAFRITNGLFTPAGPSYNSGQTFGFPGAQPTLTANGQDNTTAIDWELQSDAYGRQGTEILHAYAARPAGMTGNLPELFNSNQTGQRDQLGGSVKFTTVTVSNGHVFTTEEFRVSVFGLFPTHTTAPAAPSNLMATPVTDTSIRLNWTNPTPNNATGIEIYRSTTDNMHYALVNTVPAGAASYLDTGLSPTGTYFYHIRAVNQVGASGFSNEVQGNPAISPPVLSFDNVCSNAISLAFTRPGVANDHYEVQKSTNGGMTFGTIATLPGNQTTYTDSNLTPGQYQYRIRAFTTPMGGMSVDSNVVQARIGAGSANIDYFQGFPSPPAPPPFDLQANGAAQFAETTARLTNANTQVGSLFSTSKKNILHWTTDFSVRLHEGTQPNYADGFTFVIQANSPSALGQGNGGLGYQGIPNSVAIKFQTFSTGAEPGNSTGIFFNGDRPTVPIQPGEENNVLDPTRVNLQSQSIKTISLSYDDATHILHETIVDADHPTTPYNHDYTVDLSSKLGTVSGGNSIGYVGFTASTGTNNAWELQDVTKWRFTPIGPAAPGLRVTNTSPTAIDLAWRCTSADEQGFRIFRSTSPSGPFNQIAQVGAGVTTYHDTMVTAGTAYYYRVQAFNADGSSGFSNTVAAVAAPGIQIAHDSGFANHADIQINGNASFPSSAPILRLTDAVNSQASSAFFTTRVGTGAFSTTFVLRDQPGIGAADSLSFVIQNDPRGTAALGGGGGGGGYSGIQHSVALKFDLYDHGDHNPSTGLFINGQAPDSNRAQDVPLAPINLGSGHPLRVDLIYDGTTLSETVTDSVSGQTFNHTYTGNLAQVIGSGAGYVGFTGGTGGENATQDIVSWTGQFSQPAPTATLMVAGFPNPIGAGTPGSFTVTAKDANGFVAPGYLGTVHFTSSDTAAMLPMNYTFTAADNGAHTFTATLNTQGTQSITATDTVTPSITGAQTGILVTPPSPCDTVDHSDGFFSHNDLRANGTASFPLPGPLGVFTGQQDIGNPPAGGGASFNNDSYSVTGTGSDVWDTADHFHYVYRPLNGDGEIVARMASGTSPDFWTKSGLMIRATLDAGSPNAFVAETPNPDHQEPIFQWRDNPNGGSGDTGNHVNHVQGVPLWLRMTRTGNSFSAFWARDLGSGTHGAWNQIGGPHTINMGASVFVGLAENAHVNDNRSATMTFDNLFVTGAQVPLRLVNGGDGQAGSAFTTGVQRISTFNTSFTFQPRVGNNPNAPLADGLTFTIQNDPRGNTALGDSGGAQGYGREANDDTPPAIRRSVAIKFDFWKPNGDHSSTGLYVDGHRPNNPPDTRAGDQFRDLAGSPINFNANVRGTPPHTYKVDLAYDGTTLQETLTDLNKPAGSNSFTTSYVVNIPALVGGGAAYVGFTAGTGGADSIIDVQNWTGMFCVPLGPTTHFSVTGFPNPALAGSPGTFTVSALDANNRVTPAYRGTVHFTSSDGRAMLPMDYTFNAADAGTHQFTATLNTLGLQSITATDTGTPAITGAQTGILVVGPCDTVDHSAGFASHGDLRSNGSAQFTGTVLRLTDGGASEAASAFTTARVRISTFSTSFTFQPRPGGNPIADGLTFTIQNDPRGAGALGSGGGALGYALEGTGNPAITPSVAIKFDFWKPNGNHSSTGLYFNGQHPDNDAPPPNVFRDLAGSPIDFNNSAQLNPPHSYRVDLGYDGITLRETITDLNKPAGSNSFTTSYVVNIPAVVGGNGSGYVGFTAGTGGATSTIDIQTWTGMFCIPPGPATHFAVSGYPSPTTAGDAHSFTVTALDANNIVATGYRGLVHFTSSDGQAMLPMDYTFNAADAGVHTFSATLKTAGMQSITATDTVTASITGTQSGILVNPAAASTFMVSGFPSPATAGVAGNFTVTAKDAFGNIATGYRGIVHFTSSDGQAMLPMDYTFNATDAGVHMFSATLKTAGTQSITATDTVTASITGTQSNILVNPGPVTQLLVTGFPTPTQAGAVHFFTVTAKDAFGNRATNYRGTVHFSSTDPQAFLPPDYTFTADNSGAVTLDAAFLTAGSQMLTATDTASNVTGSQTVVVTPAAADHFTLTANPTTVTAGQTTMVTVTAFDHYGNVATGYLGTVHFTSSDAQATLPQDYTFVPADAGQKTLPAILRTTAAYGPGPQTITATDTGRGFAATTTVIVSPAAAATFAIQVPDCGCATAGQQFGFTVYAIDPYGNIDVNYAGTVHFSSSDKQAILPDDHDFTLAGGVSSFVATLFAAGDQTITATDTNDKSITGTSTITVAPAAATHFVLTAPGRVEMGVPFNLTVSAYDQYGNLDFNYVGTVHFDSSDPDAVLPRDYTFQSSDGGVATFGVILNTPTDQTISATDTSDPTIFGSVTINVFVSGGGSPGRGGQGSLARALAATLIVPPSSLIVANPAAPAGSSAVPMETASSSAAPLQPDEQRPSISTAPQTTALDSLMASWDGSLLPSLLTDDLIQARLS